MAKGVGHYLKDGTKHTGGMHKMTNGDMHTGDKHTDSSKKLYHYRDLPSTSSKKRARKRS